MYEKYFGFREKPFTLSPDPSFLYLGKKHRTAFAMLEYGISQGVGITVITGEIGSGKTTLIRHLLNSVEGNCTIGLISNTHRTFGELLQWACLAYGLPCDRREKVVLYKQFVEFMIGEYAKGNRTVLVVDEAQNMDATTLEELRVLSNINADKDQVLQLVLVGQPELRTTLSKPDLRQLVQRIGVAYHLRPLSLEETRTYIMHRLSVVGGNPDIFEPNAYGEVFEYSGGVPRLINKICDMAFVYAYAGKTTKVTGDLVREIVNEQRENGIEIYMAANDTANIGEPIDPSPTGANKNGK